MVAKLRLVFSITILFLSFYGAAQSTYWKNTELKGNGRQFSKQRLQVEKAKAFTLNEVQFKQVLASKASSKIIYFPDEYGNQIPFQVEETYLFSKELAEKYPSIKSFKGTALNDATKQIRFSVSHNGVQSMINTTGEKGALFMQKSGDDAYVLYRRTEQTERDLNFICSTIPKVMEYSQNLTAKLVNDQTLRTFRVAISASGEYTKFHGGTKADALAAINATLTRVNGVFERDLAISLQLIANTDDVIYTDPDTDPYTGSLSTQVQSTLTKVIGESNYDIGHLFNQQDGALDGNSGFIGAVCKDGRKGSAYTTLSSPVGDMFDIDLVAHEMGHQFGANHSFSHISEGTTVQVEPASGTTIMGYAGITQNNNNVAANSNDYFHYVSIVQIRDYLETVSCGQAQPFANTAPTLTPLSDYAIPKGTAFLLTGAATDPDATDVLSYTWEQIDNGVVTQATFGPNNPSGANFRSLPPSSSPQRYFPNLNRVLKGQLTQTLPTEGDAWETVSNVGRNLNFSLTVRDNALNGGQSDSDELQVTVVNEAGPFVVTSQETSQSYVAGSVQKITWDVAKTNLAPISAETVSILLSTDGGFTYTTVLAEDIINDGEHSIIMPGITTSSGRIMVKASNNIFFAVNASNFSITPSEIVLNFQKVSFDVCKPDDISIPFVYETYLGFNEESTFSAVSLPTGLTAVFTPPTATDTNTPVTVDLTGVSNLTEGTYPIQIRASSATFSKEIILQLRVFDANFNAVQLLAPSDGFEDASKDVVLKWEADVGNTAYDIEIATDLGFAAIIESATVNTNSYSPSLLDNNTQYYWRVRPKNDCGEGAFSSPYTFSTIQFNCTTKSATGLPLSISSIATPIVSSKIAFFEDLPVADINVTLDLEHTFLADLVINLISPAGTTVALVSSSCGDSRNIKATFDDEGTSFECGVEPAISGIVKPLGTLSSFNGESILGEWVLEIRDNVASDGGRLKAFSLEVCVEGDFRPDADKDGVFDDVDDLCLGTPEGQEVNGSGCPIYRFPRENFSIHLESESCPDNNDGQIMITPKVALDYQVTVSGNGIDLTQAFSNSFNLANLSAGAYSLCIVGTDGLVIYEEYCVEVKITEPELLTVSSELALDGTQLTLSLNGSSLYTIELNGTSMKTQEELVILELKKGFNSLKVYTDIPCQGIYEEQFALNDKPVVFPNPVKNMAQIYLGAAEGDFDVHIFSAEGRWLSSITLTPQAGTITLDFSTYATGIYYLKYEGSTLKGTTKVIKE
ncbi:reprolysin-like metallopeptidase [Maribacter sp. X9]|uniref:zinc-dependent metalloprotease n=1 Tax=Maribacter sp. X9 TaxID=3402159 RepID=UPI003AF38F46